MPIKIKRSDIGAGLIAGFLVAVLGIIIFTNLAVKLGALRWAAPLILPILAVIGLWVAAALSRFWPTLWQLVKYLVTGALNTFIDLGVLNLLIYITGTTTGVMFSVFKAAGFLAAVINSFFWNKFWTFESRKTEGAGTEFSKFLAISFIGIILNTGIASFLVNVIGAPGNISEKLWANIAAITAGAAVFLWNFLGYKLIVFKNDGAGAAD